METRNRKNCKDCGSELVVRATQKKASQLKKAYYYTAYYYCLKCEKLYHSDEFKVMNTPSPQSSSTPVKQAASSVRPVKGEGAGKFPSPIAGEGQGEGFDAEIWTDGACVHNGYINAKAAWAFVSGKTEMAGLVEGKQTNNVAEALAIYNALLWAKSSNYKKVRVYSDSQITINNMKKNPGDIKQNAEIFKDISGLIKENDMTVHFEKVLGHSGDINNERADKLANGLAGKKKS